MTIATLRVLRRNRGVTVSIDVAGQRRTWRTPWVFVGNNEYAIDGIRLGARARLGEGTLFRAGRPGRDDVHARGRGELNTINVLRLARPRITIEPTPGTKRGQAFQPSWTGTFQQTPDGWL